MLKSFVGIAIKLYDGIIISWDGRVIRHGTTLTRVMKDNHTYGCVFVAKKGVMKAALSSETAAKIASKKSVSSPARSILRNENYIDRAVLRNENYIV